MTRHATPALYPFLAALALGIAAQAFGQVGTLPQISTAAEMQRRQTLMTETQRSIQQSQEEAPALYDEEFADVGRQFLVKVKPRRTWVEARVDSQFYYTSNFGYTEPGTDPDPIDTSVLVSTAEAAISPTFDISGGKLNPRIGYRHQWYNYDIVENNLDIDGVGFGLNNFDFDIQTIFAEARYTFPGGDWYAFVGAEFNRYLGHEGPIDDYAEFYKEWLPYLGIQKSFSLGERSLFAIEYDAYLHVSEVTPASDILTADGIPLLTVDENGDLTPYAQFDPRPNAYINDRMDHILTVSFAHMPIENVILRPFYRFMYTDYLKGDWGDRNDTIQTIGLIATWNLAQWCQLRGFISYDHHESDDERIPDYRKWDAGSGVTLSVRF